MRTSAKAAAAVWPPCPKKVLKLSGRMNRRGYLSVEYAGQDCTGCAICFYNCPEPYAIEVHGKEK